MANPNFSIFSHRCPLQTTNTVHCRFGSAVTVVEMDGEIDMDNMEEQLKDRLPKGGAAERSASGSNKQSNSWRFLSKTSRNSSYLIMWDLSVK